MSSIWPELVPVSLAAHSIWRLGVVDFISSIFMSVFLLQPLHTSYLPNARAVQGEYRPSCSLENTDRAQRGLYRKDSGLMVSQYGTE